MNTFPRSRQFGSCFGVVLAAWLVLPPGSAAAQTNQPTPASASGAFKTDFLWGSAATNRLRLGAFVDYSYVAPGAVNYRGADGDSDVQTVTTVVNGELPLDANWYVPFGIGSANAWLDPVSGAPVPDRYNTLYANVGLGKRLNAKWTVAGSLGPALYTFEDVQGEDVGFTASARLVYRARPTLTLTFGAFANPDSDIPVFPAFGARWDVRTNLTLNLMFPKPGVIYRASSKVSLFVGAGLNGATFRTDEKMETRTGLRGFDRELATYWNAHVGAGVEYEIVRRLSINLEAGYSVGRRIRYKDVDKEVRFDPSPYVQTGVRYRF